MDYLTPTFWVALAQIIGINTSFPVITRVRARSRSLPPQQHKHAIGPALRGRDAHVLTIVRRHLRLPF